MGEQVDMNRLLEAVDRFPRVRLLVLGDVMLDRFVWGQVERISPEAPVPVVDVTDETELLGGSANVVNNIASAGGRALAAGLVGRDRPGRGIIRMLENLGADPQGLVSDPDRPTTVKTRVVARPQQVVRFDREARTPAGPRALKKLTGFLASLAGRVDGVIVSDYGKGVIGAEIMAAVRRLFDGRSGLIAVDPAVKNFHLYRNTTILTPNHHEAAQGAGLTVDSEEALYRVGRKIIADLDCEAVLITRGEQGMTLFERSGGLENIPTMAREVFDVTGAGDTVIAILTLGLAAGLSRLEASVLANRAAGVVVGKVGTAAVTARELRESVMTRPSPSGPDAGGAGGKAS
ncbi:MAG: D-glycero-beta-D-manno-heptose-7-phosphate kinase [Pseudomonadota bacterium]